MFPLRERGQPQPLHRVACPSTREQRSESYGLRTFNERLVIGLSGNSLEPPRGRHDGHDCPFTDHFKAPVLSMIFLNAVMISCMSLNE
jgi:hypothetical protein